MNKWQPYNGEQLDGDFTIQLKNREMVYECYAAQGHFISHDSVLNPNYHGKQIPNSDVAFVKETKAREFKWCNHLSNHPNQ